MKCNIIINHSSGKGKSTRIWQQAAAVFKDAGWSIEVYFDMNNISQYLDNCQAVIAVGGDGTFHSVINSLMQSGHKIPLGLIPAGTGNALMMDLGLSDPYEAVKRIISGNRRFIDILEVNTCGEKYYSISVVGWAMFSAANQTAEKLRWTWKLRYNIAALWHIIRKRTYPAVLEFKDHTEQDRYIAIFAANTKHTGRGMKAAPRAEIDDGLLDLVTIRNTNRFTLLRLFKDFVSGNYLENEQVTYRQLTEFNLQTDLEHILNIDGEVKGKPPFTVRVLPKAIELML